MLASARFDRYWQRAVLVGVAIVAVAHLPPLHLAQRIDSEVLDAFAAYLQAPAEAAIRVMRLDTTPLNRAGRPRERSGGSSLAVLLERRVGRSVSQIQDAWAHCADERPVRHRLAGRAASGRRKLDQ